MAIQQVIYRSSATRCLNDDELERLVMQAQLYNCSQAVTGVLFSAGQQFLQVLEGEQAAVAKLYDHIAQDPRHTGVVTLLNASVTARLFPAWHMGFGQVCPRALARLSAYLDPQFRATLVPCTYNAQEIMSDLLCEFVAEHPPAPAELRAPVTTPRP